MSDDPRIEIPEGLRNVGIFGGLVLMALGLLLGWVKAGRSAELPVTGVKQPAKGPSAVDRLVEALVGRLGGPGGGPDGSA